KNNLHQLQVAFEQHVDKLGMYPSSGWGSGWVGLADQGYGANQPGGWIYQILPYMDQGALHDLDKGLTATVSAGSAATASGKRVTTVIGGLYCPTRRAPKAYPLNNIPINTSFSPLPQVGGRTDYAANGGSIFYARPDDPGPGSLSAAANYPWPNLTMTGFNG